MSDRCILVVEDEDDIREVVRYALVKEGYRAIIAASGEEALKLVRAERPDLVLLDLMLPGVDGLEVCRRLKKDPATEGIPVIMLTAKGEESDVVAGLELGADDYVTKPFSPRVLVARVRGVFRRESRRVPDDGGTVSAGAVVINPGRHEVLVAGRPVELSRTEFKVLHLLARRPGWVYTRGQIVSAVHGGDAAVTERAVDVQIVGLRRKLGAAGGLIETVRGVGYRFKE